jgi:hypothetical protein
MNDLAAHIGEPEFRALIISTLYGAHAPEWMGRAACAGEGEQRSWDYTDQFYDDDVAGDTPFPEPLLRLIGNTCAKCPVRRECLEDAYAQERHLEDIPGTAPVRQRWVEDGTRSGVWGGIPGPIRERFAHSPTRLDDCEAWLQELGQERKWGLNELVETLWQGQETPLDPNREYA